MVSLASLDGRGKRKVGMTDLGETDRILLDAVCFAAEKHRYQKRKGEDQSPYINHPLAVAHILATGGGVVELETLLAAVLHDTIEDTDTTAGEIQKLFGNEVRDLVLELTDDKSQPLEERKRLQVIHAARLSPKAKLIRLADKIANIEEMAKHPPKGWSPKQRAEYLEWSASVVSRIKGVNPPLELRYVRSLAKARRSLAPMSGATA